MNIERREKEMEKKWLEESKKHLKEMILMVEELPEDMTKRKYGAIEEVMGLCGKARGWWEEG